MVAVPEQIFRWNYLSCQETRLFYTHTPCLQYHTSLFITDFSELEGMPCKFYCFRGNFFSCSIYCACIVCVDFCAMQKWWASGHWLLQFPWQLQRLVWKANSYWSLWSLFLNELSSMFKYLLYFCSCYNSEDSLCFLWEYFRPTKFCARRTDTCELPVYQLFPRVAAFMSSWGEVSISWNWMFCIHCPDPTYMARAETLLKHGSSRILPEYSTFIHVQLQY